MTFNFREKIEFENNKRRIMSFFPKGKKKGLKFSDIKEMIGLTPPRTSRLLKSLIEEGFLEKRKSEKKELYFSRLTTYRGDFDIWDLMSRIEKISQKNGRIVNEDLGYISGLCSVLAYGCLPYEKLTPLEREMLFQLMNNFRNNFLELRQLNDSINSRILIEKKNKLPKTCKNIMFGKDSGEIDFAAVHKIYGDALWSYIFNHYTKIFHFQLTKGLMDIHGLKDLFKILDRTVEAIGIEVKKKGMKAHDFPETETSKSIPLIPTFLLGLNADNIEENSIGVMITHSPRCLSEYSDQVGRIIKDEIEFWKNYKSLGKEKQTEENDWDTIIHDFSTKKSRCEWLQIKIIDRIMLRPKKFSDIDRKLMINDSMLNEIFDKTEIEKMIVKLENLHSRLMYFYRMNKAGKSLNDLKKNPKWFREEEIEDYDPIHDFVRSLEFSDNITKECGDSKNAIDIEIDLKNENDIMNLLEKYKSHQMKQYKKTKKL